MGEKPKMRVIFAKFPLLSKAQTLSHKPLVRQTMPGSYFIWGGEKKGVRGGMGEKPNMRVIFAKFPLLSKAQFLSHKPLVRQTSNHYH